MAVYNDKLIIGTYDTSTLCSGITQLTDGSLLNMTKEEFAQRIQYIIDLLKTATGLTRSASYNEVTQFSQELGAMLNTANGVSTFDNNDMDFVEKFNSIKEKYEKYVRPILSYVTRMLLT